MVWMPAEDLTAHELRLNYSDVNEADVWGLGVRLPFFSFFFKQNSVVKYNYQCCMNMNDSGKCRMLWIWIISEPNHLSSRVFNSPYRDPLFTQH